MSDSPPPVHPAAGPGGDPADQVPLAEFHPSSADAVVAGPQATADVGEIARRVFGFESLRPGQREVIGDVLAGRPVVTVMPTGAGKSLCYQLPAVLFAESGGFTLVISPLIALMKDQVDSLQARDVSAAALTSAASPGRQREILDGIRAGFYTLVYIAPERFRSPRFLSALSEVRDKLVLMAIDEAHCISEWGHDFRPDYRRLGAAVHALAPPRLLALTATATPEVREDIAVQLGMGEPNFHVRGFDRPNLWFIVERAGGAADKSQRLITKVRDRVGGVALVYAATRKNAERYAEALQEAGLRVRVYHAGLADEDRVSAQEAFMGDKLDVIVATNAFGMGVDKADIRLVVHADVPRSPEAYYQEAGRGGRDGQQTGCVLLFNHADVRLQEFLIDASFPDAEVLRGLWRLLRDDPQVGWNFGRMRGYLPGNPHESVIKSAIRILLRHGLLYEQGDFLLAGKPEPNGPYPPLDVQALARRADSERRKLRTMIEYAYYPRCRRHFILEYFGDVDWRQRTSRCSGCDNCLGLSQTRVLDDEQTDAARKLLALINQISGRFGRTKLAALANGTDDDDRFAELPERGCLRGTPGRQLMELMRALEGGGLVDVSRGEYPTLAITSRGRQIVAGSLDIDEVGLSMIAKTSTRKSRKAKKSSSRTSKGAGTRIGAISDEPLDHDLVERLRSLRYELATEKSVPAYVVFSNKTLEAIARARPGSTEELAEVHGIGPGRLEAYGAQILAVIGA